MRPILYILYRKFSQPRPTPPWVLASTFETVMTCYNWFRILRCSLSLNWISRTLAMLFSRNGSLLKVRKLEKNVSSFSNVAVKCSFLQLRNTVSLVPFGLCSVEREVQFDPFTSRIRDPLPLLWALRAHHITPLETAKQYGFFPCWLGRDDENLFSNRKLIFALVLPSCNYVLYHKAESPVILNSLSVYKALNNMVSLEIKVMWMNDPMRALSPFLL